MNFSTFYNYRSKVLEFYSNQKDTFDNFSSLRTVDFILNKVLKINSFLELTNIIKIINDIDLNQFNRNSLILIVVETYINQSNEDINLIFNLNISKFIILNILLKTNKNITINIKYENIFNLIRSDFINNNLIRQFLIENFKNSNTVDVEKILLKLKLEIFNIKENYLKDIRLEILLNIATEFNVTILTKDETIKLFYKIKLTSTIYHSFLIYISKPQFEYLIDILVNKLRENILNYSEIIQIFDTIALILNEKFKDFITKNNINDLIKTLNLNGFEIERILNRLKVFIEVKRIKRFLNLGIVPAQFMLKGQIDSPGEGSSGGLSTLFLTLGNSLSLFPETESILTFTFVNSYKDKESNVLINKKHKIIEIPLEVSKFEDQLEIIKYEYILKSYVRNSLKYFNLKPDIFQIRYNDNFSKALLDLALDKNIKLLLILTADPHRNIYKYMAKDPQLLSDSENYLLFNKIFIADYLLSKCDAITIFPNFKGVNYIKSYFPQLYSYPLNIKPLRIIAEGITLDKKYKTNLTPEILNKIYSNNFNKGIYINEKYKNRPIILNVGRLANVKQQDLLLKCWIETKLYKKYNLVIIGGNQNNPIGEEKEVLKKIKLITQEHKKIEGMFSLINAISNYEIRRLEFAINKYINFESPNIYLCSSFKEEFGISILEAMDAKFLLIGPQNGGLSTYITNNINGFLINTKTINTLKEDIDNVLNKNNFTSKHLKEIAGRGLATIQNHYNIDKIAGDFIDYFNYILNHK